MESSMQALAALFPAVPLLAVYLVGVIFSSSKMGPHRRAATLGMTGFGCLLIARMIGAGGTLMLLPAYRGSTPLTQLTGRLATINLAATLLSVGGTIVLMIALFVDREKKPAIG